MPHAHGRQSYTLLQDLLCSPHPPPQLSHYYKDVAARQASSAFSAAEAPRCPSYSYQDIQAPRQPSRLTLRKLWVQALPAAFGLWSLPASLAATISACMHSRCGEDGCERARKRLHACMQVWKVEAMQLVRVTATGLCAWARFWEERGAWGQGFNRYGGTMPA